MEAQLRRLRFNIELKICYIEQRIAESLAENLRRDFAWESSEYIEICHNIMKISYIPKHLRKRICRNAATEGYASYNHWLRTGEYTYHNGSGQHPRILLGDTLHDLADMLFLYQEWTDGIYQVAAAK